MEGGGGVRDDERAVVDSIFRRHFGWWDLGGGLKATLLENALRDAFEAGQRHERSLCQREGE